MKFCILFSNEAKEIWENNHVFQQNNRSFISLFIKTKGIRFNNTFYAVLKYAIVLSLLSRSSSENTIDDSSLHFPLCLTKVFEQGPQGSGIESLRWRAPFIAQHSLTIFHKNKEGKVARSTFQMLCSESTLLLASSDFNHPDGLVRQRAERHRHPKYLTSLRINNAPWFCVLCFE